MVASDYRVQDQLEGTIRLQRGQLCVEQEGGAGHRGGRGEYLWVKVRGMCVEVCSRYLIQLKNRSLQLLSHESDFISLSQLRVHISQS